MSVINLSREAPRSHQGGVHKVHFLRNAVVGMPWSNEPVSQVATHNFTFQQFSEELEAALQLDKEAALSTLQYSAEQLRRSPVPENRTGVLYIVQVRYMNDRKGRKGTVAKPSRPFHREPNRISRPFTQGKARFDPSLVRGCFNCCGNPLMKDCRKSLNTVRAASRMIFHFSKKKGTQPYAVHQVLAELCKQIDSGHDKSHSSTRQRMTAKYLRI